MNDKSSGAKMEADRSSLREELLAQLARGGIDPSSYGDDRSPLIASGLFDSLALGDARLLDPANWDMRMLFSMAG